MKSHHHLAIEHLARESQIPVNEVARLYEDARARLAVGARVNSFLGIFALRYVRKALRQRNGELLPARPPRVSPAGERSTSARPMPSATRGS